MIRSLPRLVRCRWCLRWYAPDEHGRPEAHRRLSVAPRGGSRWVPCVSPTELALRGLAPPRALS